MKAAFSGLLLLATLTLLWFGVGQGDTLPFNLTADDVQVRESYLEEGERWTYDENGMRNQRVRILSGVSYAGDPLTYLQGLEFEGPDDNGRYWHVNAGAGRLRQTNSALFLHQGVELRESAGEGVLTAPHLTIHPTQNRAKTNAPVTLKLQNSLTTAQGLELDLDSGVARLLSEVETIYEG